MSEEWQQIAVENGCEEESYFLEPLEGDRPEEHILWDLDECEGCAGYHEDFDYNGTIGICNSSAMLIQFSDDMETALVMMV